VRKIIPNERGGWNYEFYEGEGYQLGVDLTEVNLHGLSILVRQPKEVCQGQAIKDELVKFARVFWHGLVSQETIGPNYNAESLCTDGDVIFLQVFPRLFVPNN
jgi:hypothetical protein